MAKVTQYETHDGVVPFQKWFSTLSAKAALKVRTAIAQMEVGNLGDYKSVGAGVWERRIHFEKGYRVYFARDGDELIILFWGGSKTRQQSDIAKAKGYSLEYKTRKKQQEKKEHEKKADEAKTRSRITRKKK